MSNTKQHNTLFYDLNFLQKNLGGDVETINGISTLNFNSINGKGRIRHLSFDDGIEVINMEATFNNNFILNLGDNKFKTLNFIFCLEGPCSISLGTSTILRKLEELQTAITETDNSTNSILLRPQVKYIINIITINQDVYFKEVTDNLTLPKIRLTALLKSLKFHDKQIHLGTYNAKIGLYIRELLGTKESNTLTEQMHFEGISHLILASHIEHLYNQSLQIDSTCGLTISELKKINFITDLIQTNPQDQYSVFTLCELSGLSPAKLQKGCKSLHGRTVSDFVRYVRLQKAEHLIKTSDLNISEIVYSIGFTSRSYFCKIFKKEYGCSPKTYKKKSSLKSVVS